MKGTARMNCQWLWKRELPFPRHLVPSPVTKAGIPTTWAHALGCGKLPCTFEIMGPLSSGMDSLKCLNTVSTSNFPSEISQRSSVLLHSYYPFNLRNSKILNNPTNKHSQFWGGGELSGKLDSKLFLVKTIVQTSSLSGKTKNSHIKKPPKTQ